MTSMTPRALARSATISEGVAIELSLETRLALTRADALQLTRLSVGPYGRFCPVHVWPVLRCPPRVKHEKGCRADTTVVDDSYTHSTALTHRV